MAKQKRKTKKRTESDSTYFLKLVLFFIFGTLWVRLININIGKDSTPPLGWYYPCQYNQESIYKIQKRRLRWKFSQME